MNEKQIAKLKVGKPYWESKLIKRWKQVIIEVSRTVRWSNAAYQLERVVFTFPLSRFLPKKPPRRRFNTSYRKWVGTKYRRTPRPLRERN